LKENLQKHKTKKSYIGFVAAEIDILTTCPKCGGEVNIWSEGQETVCIFCQYRMFKNEKTVH
jgi:DNA-directed RNA polymerase subunit RPC12/RpoP